MKFLFFIFLSALYYREVVLNSCLQHETCDACIRDSSPCVWCAKESFYETRCKPAQDLEENWCPNNILNPKSSAINTKDEEFNSDVHKKIIQIKPQSIKIKIRPGVPTNFSFSYNAATNYPVDLYFLFDGSKSKMDRIKYETAAQTEKLYNMLQNMTNNIYIGLGVFVNKNTLPFTNKKNSNETYSFKHVMKLSNDSNNFKSLVNNLTYGTAGDLTGGLDALAQIIVCKKAIGWREDSLKMIIYISDKYIHVGGDGHQGGIVDPYDGECYLENGRYTNELKMDYPSVSIINKLAYDKQVIIIFESQNLENVYKKMAEEISGAKSISYKKRDHEIAAKLSEIYKDLTREIILKDNIKSKYNNKIKLSIDPNCYGAVADARCTVRKGTEIKFSGSINILEYLKDENISGYIAVQGIDEKLTLNFEIIKECDCENPTGENTTICNNGGIKKCGICECFPGKYGDNCECTKNDNNKAGQSNCRAANATVDCSGYGRCFCGKCSCQEGHKGQYCQCDNYSCARDARGICGGPSHGDCECGKCKCKPEWDGDTCNCDKSTQQCKTGSLMCFGYEHVCVCNRCQCPALEYWDARSERDPRCKPIPCTDCHSTQCNKLEECALNYVKYDSPCVGAINITAIKNLSVTTDTDWNSCLNVRGDVGCYTKFLYKYNTEIYGIELIVQSEFDCAESYYLFGGVCLVGLIAIGIGTLLAWKVLNDLRDRREYENFVKAQEDNPQERCMNLIHVPPTTTIYNPLFGDR